MPSQKKAGKAAARRKSSKSGSSKQAKKKAKKQAKKQVKKQAKKQVKKQAKKQVKKQAKKQAKKQVKKQAKKQTTRQAAKKAKKKAARRRAKAKKALRAVAVGDAVKLPADARNLIGRYDPSVAHGARGAETIEGIVCSIRAIRTGRLVAKTRGSLAGFVLEIIHSATFRRDASAKSAAGARGNGRLTESPVWRRLRELLRESAGTKQLLSAASGGLSGDPYSSLLDGWRVVKVKAELVEAID
jgi:hypothetical protein